MSIQCLWNIFHISCYIEQLVIDENQKLTEKNDEITKQNDYLIDELKVLRAYRTAYPTISKQFEYYFDRCVDLEQQIDQLQYVLDNTNKNDDEDVFLLEKTSNCYNVCSPFKDTYYGSNTEWDGKELECFTRTTGVNHKNVKVGVSNQTEKKVNLSALGVPSPKGCQVTFDCI